MSHKFLFCAFLFVGINQSKNFIQGEVPPTIHPILLNSSVPEEYSDLPLVGKCCPLGQILKKNKNNKASCKSFNPTFSIFKTNIFSPLFHDFNQTGLFAPGKPRSQFVAIIGDPCKHQRYALEPEVNKEDKHFLLKNGSIFTPPDQPLLLTPGVDYCMELVADLGLKTIVCSPEGVGIETVDVRIIIYACGLIISVPFLLLTIAAYCITPRLKDAHGKALCHYCGCLAIAFTTLAIVQLASEHMCDEVCISTAFIIQFSFVACFFWLNVMCIETWLFVHRRVHREECSWQTPPKRLFFYYSIWAWTPPAILILISMSMDLSPTIPTTYVKPNFGAQSCWFKSDEEAMPYFYIPVGILIVANLIFFALTARDVRKYQRELDLRRLARNQESDRREQRMIRRAKRTLIVCLGLFFLMGMNWTIEVVSWWMGGDPLAWSAFDLVNALQGVIVFGLFVLRKPIRHMVWYRIQTLRGISVDEPEVASADLRLLPIMNEDIANDLQTKSS